MPSFFDAHYHISAGDRHSLSLHFTRPCRLFHADRDMLSVLRRNPFAFGPVNPLERIYRRFRFHDCFARLGEVPPLDTRQREIVDELHRQGTVVLESYIPQETLAVMRAEFEQALRELRFETPCLAQSRLDPVRHSALIDNFLYGTPEQLRQAGAAFERSEAHSLEQAIRDFNPSTLTVYMLELSATYRRIWLDPVLLTIAAHYLGMVPKLAEAYVRRNFPSPYRTMNHYWHRDLNDRYQLLKGFVFLSDCTLDNGPHEFIRGSHADYGRLNGKRYFTDAEVDAEHPHGSATRLVSEVKAGTVILEDTRGLHRARMPLTGYRDLGYMVFMPMADDTTVKCYDFPRSAFSGLSPLQRAFVPSCDLA